MKPADNPAGNLAQNPAENAHGKRTSHKPHHAASNQASPSVAWQWEHSTFAEDNSSAVEFDLARRRHEQENQSSAPPVSSPRPATQTVSLIPVQPRVQPAALNPPARHDEEEKEHEESGQDSQPAVYPSYPPATRQKAPRVVFSADYSTHEHHRVPKLGATETPPPRRRHVPLPADDSLRIIDDLTNSPIDPLFEDSMLWEKEKPAVAAVTKTVSFILCIVIGILCTVSVRTLHTNTRAQIRAEEAQQLREVIGRSEDLYRQISDLRAQIDDLTRNQPVAVTTPQSDQMRNGTVKITGPALTVRLTDPALPDDTADQEAGQTTRRRVSDTDIQLFVDRLWAMGAEGITVNGVRLGAMTSIRAAGGKILVGLTPVQGPYDIVAVGNVDRLERGVGVSNNPKLHESLSQLGIGVSLSRDDSTVMEAAMLGTLSWAQTVNEVG